MTRYLRIENESAHALPIVEIVSSEMFAASRSLESAATEGSSGECVPLDTSDVRHGVLPGDEWVLAGSLLASAPPWIPEYVYVRRPKCHSDGLSLVVYRPRFCSDHLMIII